MGISALGSVVRGLATGRNAKALGAVGAMGTGAVILGGCLEQNRNKQPLGVANDFMGRYDANGDGKLAVGREDTRVERYDKCVDWDNQLVGFDDDFTPIYAQVCEERGTFEKRHSIGALVTAADTNKDGQVTTDEIAAVAAKYDANANGKLDSGAEIKNFNNAYEEQQVGSDVRIR